MQVSLSRGHVESEILYILSKTILVLISKSPEIYLPNFETEEIL